ncbi:MmgE/PrpD family protein [Phyllobacterium phragmitis]|uniref:MmgE/PrpD family protein n=1 Tax=Phyllobacterium phragmitis TaxID=2670329 RepID=A0A2S9ISW1_9HYPH|nr:MmgE/PrpD family protein [Phyllobacterium phragmitis]PRD43616.1 MmgE/PrpD family protein [Phyllobacterium phragmitis]
MSFSHMLAERACALTLNSLPAEALLITRRATADTIGVAFAGCRSDFIDAVEDVCEVGSAGGVATLWGRGERASILQAALLNGISAHALDFDDCSTTMGGHPSAPVLPAILALAEQKKASFGQVAEAYVTGVEVETRLARGLLPHHYDKGWHPTATLGIFGAAAAAARLLNFNTAQTANCLAMAVSMASGLKSNFGTPVKPLHVGQAAYHGLLAALLTERGLNSNPEAFEHNYGFFRLFNGEGTYDQHAILDGWDGPLEILAPGIAIKQHPCCGSAHSAIDAALKIVNRHGLFDEHSIQKIEIETHERRLAHTNRPIPKSGLDAKFSVQFLTAKALVSGQICLADFEDEGFLTPQISALLAKTQAVGHQQADAYRGTVRVTLTDGRVLEGVASTQFGRGPTNPMSDDELEKKFIDCAHTLLGAEVASNIFREIQALVPDDRIAPVIARCAVQN